MDEPLSESPALKTVQLILDESLARAVDRAARRLKSSRSAFIRQVLRDALRRIEIAELERRHREGYRRRPVGRGEFRY